MTTESTPKITNFADAFKYVNERYLYTQKNYPLIAKLDGENRKIFALNHGLLNILISAYKIGMDIPNEKSGINKLHWLTIPDEHLGKNSLECKKAILEVFKYILSIANTAGITEQQIRDFHVPDDESMMDLIHIKQMKNTIVPTFQDTLDYFIKKLATMLEKAYLEGYISSAPLVSLVASVIMSMMYWFDADWVSDLLNQIPSVMKN